MDAAMPPFMSAAPRPYMPPVADQAAQRIHRPRQRLVDRVGVEVAVHHQPAAGFATRAPGRPG